jgi:hypothetical protein
MKNFVFGQPEALQDFDESYRHAGTFRIVEGYSRVIYCQQPSIRLREYLYRTIVSCVAFLYMAMRSPLIKDLVRKTLVLFSSHVISPRLALNCAAVYITRLLNLIRLQKTSTFYSLLCAQRVNNDTNK